MHGQAGKCDFCNEEKRYVYKANGHSICGGCGKTAAYYEAMDFTGGPAGLFTGNIEEDFKKHLKI